MTNYEIIEFRVIMQHLIKNLMALANKENNKNLSYIFFFYYLTRRYGVAFLQKKFHGDKERVQMSHTTFKHIFTLSKIANYYS